MVASIASASKRGVQLDHQRPPLLRGRLSRADAAARLVVVAYERLVDRRDACAVAYYRPGSCSHLDSDHET
jgi:hypothetical protein